MTKWQDISTAPVAPVSCVPVAVALIVSGLCIVCAGSLLLYSFIFGGIL